MCVCVCVRERERDWISSDCIFMRKLCLVCSQFSLLSTRHGVCTILPVLCVTRRWTKKPSSMNVIWSQCARNAMTSSLVSCGVDCAKPMSRCPRKCLFRWLVLKDCNLSFQCGRWWIWWLCFIQYLFISCPCPAVSSLSNGFGFNKC